MYDFEPSEMILCYLVFEQTPFLCKVLIVERAFSLNNNKSKQIAVQGNLFLLSAFKIRFLSKMAER